MGAPKRTKQYEFCAITANQLSYLKMQSIIPCQTSLIRIIHKYVVLTGSKRKESCRKRKLGRNPRVPFTQHQVGVLEGKFAQTHYLSSVDVAELSAALNLTETRVSKTITVIQYNYAKRSVHYKSSIEYYECVDH